MDTNLSNNIGLVMSDRMYLQSTNFVRINTHLLNLSLHSTTNYC